MPSSVTKHGNVMVAGFQIPIRHQIQTRDNDCWAACSGMILQWAGFNTLHSVILAEGNTVGQLGGLDSAIELSETARVIRNLSNNTIQFAKVESPRTKTEDYWIQHINNYKPVLTSMGLHCRIIFGYNGSGQFAVMDPHPAQTGPILGNIGYLQANLNDAYVML